MSNEIKKDGYVKCGEADKFYRCITCGEPCGSDGHYIDVENNGELRRKVYLARGSRYVLEGETEIREAEKDTLGYFYWVTENVHSAKKTECVESKVVSNSMFMAGGNTDAEKDFYQLGYNAGKQDEGGAVEVVNNIEAILKSSSFGEQSFGWYKEQMITIISQFKQQKE